MSGWPNGTPPNRGGQIYSTRPIDGLTFGRPARGLDCNMHQSTRLQVTAYALPDGGCHIQVMVDAVRITEAEGDTIGRALLSASMRMVGLDHADLINLAGAAARGVRQT